MCGQRVAHNHPVERTNSSDFPHQGTWPDTGGKLDSQVLSQTPIAIGVLTNSATGINQNAIGAGRAPPGPAGVDCGTVPPIDEGLFPDA
jgi:hypothetical protein